MALLYHPNIRILVASYLLDTMSGNVSITLYSGEQPAPATIISSWTSYNRNSSVCLWNSENGNYFVRSNNMIYLSTSANPVVPFRNGTAAWGIIWRGSVNNSALASNSIPNSQFTVAPVTDSTGNGIIKLNSTSLTTSTSVTINSMSLTINL